MSHDFERTCYCETCNEHRNASWDRFYAEHKCDVCGEQSTQGSTVPIPASWNVCDICAKQACMPYDNIVATLKGGRLGSALFDVSPVLAFAFGASLARLNIPVDQLLADAGVPAFKEMVA